MRLYCTVPHARRSKLNKDYPLARLFNPEMGKKILPQHFEPLNRYKAVVFLSIVNVAWAEKQFTRIHSKKHSFHSDIWNAKQGEKGTSLT